MVTLDEISQIWDTELDKQDKAHITRGLLIRFRNMTWQQLTDWENKQDSNYRLNNSGAIHKMILTYYKLDYNQARTFPALVTQEPSEHIVPKDSSVYTERQLAKDFVFNYLQTNDIKRGETVTLPYRRPGVTLKRFTFIRKQKHRLIDAVIQDGTITFRRIDHKPTYPRYS